MIKKRWTPEEEKFLIENYVILSTRQISDTLKRTHKSVIRKAEEMNVQMPNKERTKKIILNSMPVTFEDKSINYFIAGFVAGEGCFTKSFNNYKCPHFRFKISVSIKDKYLIEEFNKELDEGSITFREKQKENWENQIALTVTSHLKIYTHLIPFMEKFLLNSNKKTQFEKWRDEFYNYYHI